MSQDTSEEKSLQASNLKLKKQREKGQIAKSPDMYSAVQGVIGFTFFLLFLGYGFEQILHIFNASVHATSYSWDNGLQYASDKIFRTILVLVSPIAIAITIAIILANILYNKGIPFSLDPIKPRFEKLNPVEGFKKIFGRRTLIDGSQKIVRIAFWFCIAFGIVWMLAQSLVNSPICGYNCTFAVGETLAIRLVIAAILILLIVALIDMPIQSAMFMHEMKMGKSEKKREDKDQYGAPEVRSERKRMHREILNSSAKAGIESATFVISGEKGSVAMRYIADEEGVPSVVAKATGESNQDFLSKANQLGLQVINDDDMVAKLKGVNLGSHVPKDLFNDLAKLMSQHGAV
ncbi:MAG: EscU/YscU/HrcU family type III secretion system export apparatus switch protein [Pseudomonadota bacterium]